MSGCRHSPPAASSSWGEGLASWYGKDFAGRATASGAKFDPDALTAAHRTLAFGTCIRVEAVSSGRTVEVRVNDRGPHVPGRIIDLSEAAAAKVGLLAEGVGRVRLTACR